GVPVAGRPHADLRNMIGMFVNTLAVRNHPDKEKTFKELLKEVKENSLQAYDNQSYQLEELIENIAIKRDISRNPLFDVIFNLNNIEYEVDL
ncbi:condensation domain-containing protein, partial [Chryseobacterium sp. SIMBA_029]